MVGTNGVANDMIALENLILRWYKSSYLQNLIEEDLIYEWEDAINSYEIAIDNIGEDWQG